MTEPTTTKKLPRRPSVAWVLKLACLRRIDKDSLHGFVTDYRKATENEVVPMLLWLAQTMDHIGKVPAWAKSRAWDDVRSYVRGCVGARATDALAVACPRCHEHGRDRLQACLVLTRHAVIREVDVVTPFGPMAEMLKIPTMLHVQLSGCEHQSQHTHCLTCGNDWQPTPAIHILSGIPSAPPHPPTDGDGESKSKYNIN